MTKIKPHESFDLFRPDEVAECWGEIYRAGEDLYVALWNVVDDYEKMDRENGGPADFVGVNCVSKFWDKFTPDQQARLNQCAIDHDKWIDRFMAGDLTVDDF